MVPSRSLRLISHSAVQLDRLSYENGEVFFDDNNNTLRLMDGKNQGGTKLTTEPWTQAYVAAELSTASTALQSLIALKAPIASPTFTGTVTSPAFSGPLFGSVTGNVAGNVTGNVTGNLTGNVTGNVTGNLTGNADTVTNGIYATGSYTNPTWIVSIAGTKVTGDIAGNAGTATKLLASVTINNVSFDGSSNITVTASANTLTSATLNASVVNSSLTSVGTLVDLNVTGDITTANAVTADSASVANDVTVGGYANISTVPTAPQHVTNKQYVDSRGLAIAIAMG